MRNPLCFPTNHPVSMPFCRNNHLHMTWLVLTILKSMCCLCPSQVKRGMIVLDNIKSRPLHILASSLQSPKPIVRGIQDIMEFFINLFGFKHCDQQHLLLLQIRGTLCFSATFKWRAKQLQCLRVGLCTSTSKGYIWWKVSNGHKHINSYH